MKRDLLEILQERDTNEEITDQEIIQRILDEGEPIKREELESRPYENEHS